MHKLIIMAMAGMLVAGSAGATVIVEGPGNPPNPVIGGLPTVDEFTPNEGCKKQADKTDDNNAANGHNTANDIKRGSAEYKYRKKVCKGLKGK